MNNIKNHNCRYCSKTFSSTKSRWNHETLLHKEEKNNSKVVINSLECCYCKKIYASKFSLERHQLSNCKEKIKVMKKIENNKSIIKKIENDKLILKNSNNTNNNNTNLSHNNINSNNKTLNNYNIIINPVNNPNIDNFSLLDICDIFDEQFNTILTIIEKIYFNDKLKENHSFCVLNLNGEYAKTFDSNNNEITKIKKYLFDEVFTLMVDKIKLLYSKYKNKLFELPKQQEIKNKIKALESMQNERLPTYKSYLKLINILAYDKKNIVTNTWDEIKKKAALDNMNITWDDKIDKLL